MKSTVMGRCTALREVGHHHDGTLQDTDEQQLFPRVIGVDAGRHLDDLGLNFLLVQQNPGQVVANVKLIHPGAPLDEPSQEQAGSIASRV